MTEVVASDHCVTFLTQAYSQTTAGYRANYRVDSAVGQV